MWHGFIFPWAWIGSLFSDEIAVYAVPNSGGWYDFGFFLGITVLGGGSFFGSRRRRRD
ncbi:MAG: LPXTG cell wall anchor domain-containing protein [Pseudomonadota bacterium]